MAKITIGQGFLCTAEQESELRDIAAAKPAGWTIELSGPAWTKAPGSWEVHISASGFDERQAFGPDDVDAAIGWLRNLKAVGHPPLPAPDYMP